MCCSPEAVKDVASAISEFLHFSVTQKWLKLMTAFKQQEQIEVDYFDPKTVDIVSTEMYISDYSVTLVKDTSYKGLWEVSFILKEF